MFKKVFLVFILGGLIWAACTPRDQSETATRTVQIDPKTQAPLPSATIPAAFPDPGLTEAEIATLRSLEQVDAYPLYTMTFAAPYSLAVSDQSSRLADAQRISPEVWACSLFAALADPESRVYGRNFDWDFSPALLLFTDPPEGYASVAMVDIAYLGFAGTNSANLAEKPLDELVGLLNAPYIPFDGLNEAGLAIGMAAVSPGNVPDDPGKATLGSLEIIRAVLDGAASVDEALQILQRHNINFEGGPSVHYLVADAQGQAALFEHQGGKIQIIANETPWHLATNFLNSAVTEPAGRCWRYDTIYQQMQSAQGSLPLEAALDLLQEVSQTNTQWSVVYGMSTGDIRVVMGREDQEVHAFQLEMLER